jgi:hypothetical protein
MTPEEIYDAFHESREFDRMATYVARGRRFGSCAAQDVEGRWIRACKAWSKDPIHADCDELDDLETEFRLRGLDLPCERVLAEIIAAVELVSAVPQELRDARGRLREVVKFLIEKKQAN